MNNKKVINNISAFVKNRFILIVLILLIVFFSISAENFFTVSNGIAVLRQISILGLFATGMMFVMICSYVDLSLGATASFASVWFAMCASPNYWNLPLWLALLTTFGFCVVIGLVNGIVTVKTGMPPLIGTLATQTILNGIIYLMCYAKPISGIPSSIMFLGQGYIWKIPIPVIILVIVLVISYFVLNKTYYGRYLYASGSNSDAARLSGIKTDMVSISSFVIASLLAGFAGLILTCRLNSGQPQAGNSYQMNCLTACAVGGISLAGGIGNVYNLVCGICILGVLTNGMLILGINDYWQDVVQGIILIVAVALDCLQKKKKA